MWPRLYLWASMCHETHTEIDWVVCEYTIAEMNNVPQQSLTIFVPGRIHASMMASNVTGEWSVTSTRQVSPIPALHQQRPTLLCITCRNYTFACWGSYHLFPQLCHTPPPTTNKKAVKNKSKWSSILPWGRTVTSRRQFGGQHRVPHNFGGLENGALLGRRARTVTES